MEPFIVGQNIIDKDFLFGRTRQIKILTSCAKRHGNAGIIGARRFGKTCMLKTMENIIKNSPEIDAYPLYFDAKTFGGIKKDTTEVFRTLASLLAAQMCKDKLLQEGVFKVNRRCSLDISNDAIDIKVQIKQLGDNEYQEMAFFKLSEHLSTSGKYLLLLLDEIDYLLLEALCNPSDFSLIRGAATENDDSLKFWVAGTSSWSAICTNVGSPELNCGLENVTLDPLNKECFNHMWKYECSLVKDREIQEKISSLCDEIFVKTGGVPYYAKFIGSHILNTGNISIPDYSILRDYLCEVVNNRFMSDAERSALDMLAKESKVYEGSLPDAITSLKYKGLVSFDGRYNSLTIGYMIDYLRACSENRRVVNTDEIEQKELENTVDEILRLRDAINKKYGYEIFSSSTEDFKEEKSLKVICIDEPTMDAFSGAVYKLYYEGSGGSSSKLPQGFLYHDFCNMIRTLRHIYNHRDCEPNPSMTADKLWRMVNNGQPPINALHFKCVQLDILNRYSTELNQILNYTAPKTDTSYSPRTERESATPKRLEKGLAYEGEIVVTMASNGNSYKKVSCEVYPYPLQIKGANTNNLKDGDKVSFTADNEPNKNNPENLFWFATNVTLKS